jgi:hypothetical protein
MTQPIAYEVPLHERLDTVPPDARLIIKEENGLGTSLIPIGREAKLAAAELRRLHEVNQELVEALGDVMFKLDTMFISPKEPEPESLYGRVKAILAKAKGEA